MSGIPMRDEAKPIAELAEEALRVLLVNMSNNAYDNARLSALAKAIDSVASVYYICSPQFQVQEGVA